MMTTIINEVIGSANKTSHHVNCEFLQALILWNTYQKQINGYVNENGAWNQSHQISGCPHLRVRTHSE